MRPKLTYRAHKILWKGLPVPRQALIERGSRDVLYSLPENH